MKDVASPCATSFFTKKRPYKDGLSYRLCDSLPTCLMKNKSSKFMLTLRYKLKIKIAVISLSSIKNKEC